MSRIVFAAVSFIAVAASSCVVVAKENEGLSYYDKVAAGIFQNVYRNGPQPDGSAGGSRLWVSDRPYCDALWGAAACLSEGIKLRDISIVSKGRQWVEVAREKVGKFLNTVSYNKEVPATVLMSEGDVESLKYLPALVVVMRIAPSEARDSDISKLVLALSDLAQNHQDLMPGRLYITALCALSILNLEISSIGGPTSAMHDKYATDLLVELAKVPVTDTMNIADSTLMFMAFARAALATGSSRFFALAATWDATMEKRWDREEKLYIEENEALLSVQLAMAWGHMDLFDASGGKEHFARAQSILSSIISPKFTSDHLVASNYLVLVGHSELYCAGCNYWVVRLIRRLQGDDGAGGDSGTKDVKEF